jgi:hypothetical protein
VTASLGYDYYSPKYYTQTSVNGSTGRRWRRGQRVDGRSADRPASQPDGTVDQPQPDRQTSASP